MKEVLLLRQGDGGREKVGGGEGYYDVVSIQVGKQAQHAASCRGTGARSIRSLVSDKAWDCGRLHQREEWMGECMDGSTGRLSDKDRLEG